MGAVTAGDVAAAAPHAGVLVHLRVHAAVAVEVLDGKGVRHRETHEVGEGVDALGPHVAGEAVLHVLRATR